MPLDYKQSAQLRTSLIFQGRIASAAMKWADSILANTAVDITQTVKRKEVNYAQETILSLNAKAQTLQPAVVQDGAIQQADLTAEGDSTVTDTALQGAVEAAIRKVI